MIFQKSSRCFKSIPNKIYNNFSVIKNNELKTKRWFDDKNNLKDDFVIHFLIMCLKYVKISDQILI